MKRQRPGGPRTAAFSLALKRARESASEPQPKCIDDPSFVDYSTPPEPLEAALMCSECPLFDLCSDSARIERPAWGVMAGLVWEKGRRKHWGKTGMRSQKKF